MTTAKPGADDEPDWEPPPHPFGEDRGGRVERWRGIATFGKPNDLLTQIAKLAMHAAEAKTDKEMAKRALYALGLDGLKKVDGNLQKLRDALDEFVRAHAAVFPLPDDDTDEESGKAMKAAAVAAGVKFPKLDVVAMNAELRKVDGTSRERLGRMCAEGLELWLYRRVKGTEKQASEADVYRKFLRNTAKDDASAASLLEWALCEGVRLKPPPINSR